MLPEGLSEAALALFSVCVAAVAVETLVQDERTAQPLCAVCGLAASVCALRVLTGLLR